ncbi:MAG: hypothetical protein KDC11_09195, partial [Chitinophagaceae bacterium]|nr:hypothetical protein [Chitinophagaceae bacterium]
IPELQSAVDIITIQHQSSKVVLQDAKDLYANWDTMTYDDKRNIVELITDEIVVGKEDIHIKLSYLPTKTPSNNQSPPATPPRNSGKSQSHLQGGFLLYVSLYISMRLLL